MNGVLKRRPFADRRAGLAPVVSGILLLCLGWSSLIWAQSTSASQNQRGQNATHQSLQTAQATRVDHAPRLDGSLNDPLWQQTTPVTGFSQREPFEGQETTENTEVRVLYTKSAVFF